MDERTLTPGATTSGLMLPPQQVGPRLEAGDGVGGCVDGARADERVGAGRADGAGRGPELPLEKAGKISVEPCLGDEPAIGVPALRGRPRSC